MRRNDDETIRKSKYERWWHQHHRIAARDLVTLLRPESPTERNRRAITAPTTKSEIARNVELMFAAISRNIFSAFTRASRRTPCARPHTTAPPTPRGRAHHDLLTR